MPKLFPSHRCCSSIILKTCCKSSQFLFSSSHVHGFSRCLYSTLNPNFAAGEVEVLHSSKSSNQIVQLTSNDKGKNDQSEPTKGYGSFVQISNHWPEWVDLMELLLKKGYFEQGHGIPFRGRELCAKEANCIRTACLNFARDRYGLIRFFSRKDIQVIAGCGCPSSDRKVVNSGKRLRAHVRIDEGDVCRSCNLRGDCERAYVKVRIDEGGRTVDVMRILLTYGLDSIAGTLENKPCHNKIVMESVRRLLREMVDYDSQELGTDLSDGPSNVLDGSNSHEKGHANVLMKQGDRLCPKCGFLNFSRNIKCLRCDSFFQDRVKQLKEGRDHLPLKKGDWICEICNFFNFAKNVRCLQCKERPPKRLLNPGEWECESCNYINFRRNMVCLKCDHRRPKGSNASKTPTQLKHGHGGNLNRKTVGSDTQNQRRGPGLWRFVEENKNSMSRNGDAGYLDFPIVGGQSVLSQDAQRREKWALDMLERTRSAARTKEDIQIAGGKSRLSQIAEEREMLDGNRCAMRAKENEEEYYNTQGNIKHIKSCDDDMAEWFGLKQEDGEGYVSATLEL